jgi:hypothetical protein
VEKVWTKSAERVEDVIVMNESTTGYDRVHHRNEGAKADKDIPFNSEPKCPKKHNSLIINLIILKIKTSPTIGGGLRLYTCEKKYNKWLRYVPIL